MLSFKSPWVGWIRKGFSNFLAKLAALIFPDLHDEDDSNY